MKTLSFVVKLFGVAFFLYFLTAVPQLLQLAVTARTRGLPVVDVIHLNGTKFSHSLLPDGLLTVSLDDVAKQKLDEAFLKQAFPEPAEYALVLDWGRRLFASCRDKTRLYLALAEKGFLGASKDSTEVKGWTAEKRQTLERIAKTEADDRLAAHAAWQRLSSTPGMYPQHLLDLRQTVSAAVGDDARLADLLKWAHAVRGQHETTRHFDGLGSLTVRPTPPDLEWFDYWILYDRLAITDELFENRRNYLMDLFNGRNHLAGDAWTALKAYGRGVAGERVARGDLPPLDDRVAVLAAVERLAGLDPLYTPRLAETAEELVRAGALKEVVLRDHVGVYDHNRYFEIITAMAFSDEALLFAGGSLGLDIDGYYQVKELEAFNPASGLGSDHLAVPGRHVQGTFGYFLPVVLAATVLLGWLLFVSMRWLMVGLGRLLGLGGTERYRAFEETLTGKSLPHIIVAVVVVVVACILTLATLEPLYVFWIRSSSAILWTTTASVLLGGLLTETIKNLVALLFLRLGVDVSRSWVDEIVCLVLSAGLLILFQNGVVAIVLSLTLGSLSPWTLKKLGFGSLVGEG